MSRPEDRVAFGDGWSPFAMITRDDACDILQACGAGPLSLWVVLATYASREGGSCFPMHRTLTERTGIPRRTLRRWLRDLEGEGWLTRKWEATATGRRRLYELHYRARLPKRRET